MSKKKKTRISSIYLLLILSIILVSIFLSREISHDIARILTRLGVIPPTPRTFSWTIPAENLETGSVVAYKSYAQDVEGNWKETELKLFKVESVATIPAITTTTIRGLVTTTPTCVLEGGPCKFDENCCHGYCCDGFCSSSKCREKLGVWWYLIAIPVLVVIVLIVVYMKSFRRTEEDEFERLKEKWSRRGLSFQSKIKE